MIDAKPPAITKRPTQDSNDQMILARRNFHDRFLSHSNTPDRCSLMFTSPFCYVESRHDSVSQLPQQGQCGARQRTQSPRVAGSRNGRSDLQQKVQFSLSQQLLMSITGKYIEHTLSSLVRVAAGVTSK
eukprot:5175711-Amphidinium_carterae.1